jgi:hypothetical protein
VTAQDLFDELAQEHLARGDVSLGRMMNSQGLRVGDRGKYYALVSRGRLVLKLPAARAAGLVAAGEAVPFEPSPGRKMREWVALEPSPPPADDHVRWRELLADARAYAGDVDP